MERIDEIGRHAVAFMDSLRFAGQTSVGPCVGVQLGLMREVAVAIREGRFSLCMLGHLPAGVRIAVLEYLCAEPGQGYHAHGVHPQCGVTVRNISSEPWHYTASVIEQRIPQSGAVIAYNSMTRQPHLTTNVRRYAAIEPGAVAVLQPAKANTALAKFSLHYHDPLALRRPRAPAVTHLLEEVCGELTYEGELLTWSLEPTPAVAPAPRRGRRTEPEPEVEA